MDPSILRNSCGETFGLAAIEKLKRKMRVKSGSLKKKKICGWKVVAVLRQYYDRNVTTIHVCKFVGM